MFVRLVAVLGGKCILTDTKVELVEGCCPSLPLRFWFQQIDGDGNLDGYHMHVLLQRVSILPIRKRRRIDHDEEHACLSCNAVAICGSGQPSPARPLSRPKSYSLSPAIQQDDTASSRPSRSWRQLFRIQSKSLIVSEGITDRFRQLLWFLPAWEGWDPS